MYLSLGIVQLYNLVRASHLKCSIGLEVLARQQESNAIQENHTVVKMKATREILDILHHFNYKISTYIIFYCILKYLKRIRI